MKTKYELVVEATAMGIENPEAMTAEEIQEELVEHYHKDNPMLLPQLSVMTAHDMRHLKDTAAAKILDNSRWVAEPKIDGCRVKMHFGASRNRFDSRHRSATTYEFVEKTDGLPHLRDLVIPELVGTVLDGEMVMPVRTISDGQTQTEKLLNTTTAVLNSLPERAVELQERHGWMQYKVFDVIQAYGDDVTDIPFRARRVLLEDIVKQVHETGLLTRGLHLVPQWCEDFEDAYKWALGTGYEGLMLKDLDAPYSVGKRTRAWYKWKQQATLEAFVTGYTPGTGEFSGLIGALLVSVFDENAKQVEVAAVQPGCLEFRKNISVADGSLKDKVYSSVVEVSYQEVTKNRRLRHAVLVRFRGDKTVYDCMFDFDIIHV